MAKAQYKNWKFRLYWCSYIICSDVEIGDNSIIGAGSIVTKNVPPNQIWAGNPAKFIKERQNKTKNIDL